MSLVINKKIENISFDMDGVLVDFVGRFLDHYPEIGTQANMYKLDDEEFNKSFASLDKYHKKLLETAVKIDGEKEFAKMSNS